MVKRKNEVKQEANAKQAKKTQDKPADEEAELQATLGEIMEVTDMPKMGEGMAFFGNNSIFRTNSNRRYTFKR